MNNTIQQNKTGADYKRIIETMHNLNTPKPPALLRYSDIYSAVSDQEFMARLTLFNPTPNDFA